LLQELPEIGEDQPRRGLNGRTKVLTLGVHLVTIRRVPLLDELCSYREHRAINKRLPRF
jgi:hypothetical protein